MFPLRVRRCPLVPIAGTWQTLVEARILHVFRIPAQIDNKKNKRCPFMPIYGTRQTLSEARILHISRSRLKTIAHWCPFMTFGIRHLKDLAYFRILKNKNRGVSSHEEAMCPLQVKRCLLLLISDTWQTLAEARILDIPGCCRALRVPARHGLAVY